MWKEHSCSMWGFCLPACVGLFLHAIAQRSEGSQYQECPVARSLSQACKSSKGSKLSVEPSESLTLKKIMKFLSKHCSRYRFNSSLLIL